RGGRFCTLMPRFFDGSGTSFSALRAFCVSVTLAAAGLIDAPAASAAPQLIVKLKPAERADRAKLLRKLSPRALRLVEQSRGLALIEREVHSVGGTAAAAMAPTCEELLASG